MHCHSNIFIQTQANLCSLKHRVHFFFLLLTELASAYSLNERHSNNINTNSRYFLLWRERERKNKCFQEKIVGFKKAEWTVCDQIRPAVTSSQLSICSLKACSHKVSYIPSSYRCQQRTGIFARARFELQLHLYTAPSWALPSDSMTMNLEMSLSFQTRALVLHSTQFYFQCKVKLHCMTEAMKPAPACL